MYSLPRFENFGVCAFLCLLVSVIPPAATAQTLVPQGATWKYLDNGSDQGTNWRTASFDDSTWDSGAAKLGYGIGDETTRVSYGPNASAKHVTTYFRHSFSVENPAALGSLRLRVKRDDGVVIYLNGSELWRSNMPAGAIAFSTLASAIASGNGASFQEKTISASLLAPGSNIIAAEVHQANRTSSDIGFDLALDVTGTPSVIRGPYLQTGSHSGVIVRWRTNTATDSRVVFGTDLAAMSHSATDSGVTTEHSVTLSGLQPDTRYFYSVGSSGFQIAGGDSNHTFVTAPSPGSARPTRIWVLGDSGTADDNARSVRDAYDAFTGSRATDLWLMLGDNAYKTGTDAEYQRAVFDLYPSMLRQSVLWPTIGNHDTAGSATPSPAVPYFQMFTLPTNAEAGGLASGTEKYYSFDFGNIHFVCLDSMSSSRQPGSPMLTWLQNDLAMSTSDWLIAFWHHPPYSKGSHDSDVETALVEMRQNVLPILDAHGVDLVLAGHSHSYERSFLLDGHYGKSTTLAPVMIRDGGSGRSSESGPYRKATLGPGVHEGAVYVVAGSSGKATGGLLNHPAMFISMNNLGSLVLDVDKHRLDAAFLRENGAVADSFTIVKGEEAPANIPPTIALSQPASAIPLTYPAKLTLTAVASDQDGTVEQVTFYDGDLTIGTATTAPFAVEWTGGAVGSHMITAAATDNLGAITSSAPIVVTVSAAVPVTLVPADSTWKYLDNGTDQGTAWQTPAFDDTAWMSGRARLGYGNGSEATVIGYGPSGTQKYVTTYFRHAFHVSDVSAISGLKLRLLRDDGAVVYLNGAEVLRSNMPEGTVKASTLALSTVGNAAELGLQQATLPSSLLKAGLNVIAVEVHQISRSSSDMSFNLELLPVAIQ